MRRKITELDETNLLEKKSWRHNSKRRRSAVENRKNLKGVSSFTRRKRYENTRNARRERPNDFFFARSGRDASWRSEGADASNRWSRKKPVRSDWRKSSTVTGRSKKRRRDAGWRSMLPCVVGSSRN